MRMFALITVAVALTALAHQAKAEKLTVMQTYEGAPRPRQEVVRLGLHGKGNSFVSLDGHRFVPVVFVGRLELELVSGGHDVEVSYYIPGKLRLGITRPEAYSLETVVLRLEAAPGQTYVVQGQPSKDGQWKPEIIERPNDGQREDARIPACWLVETAGTLIERQGTRWLVKMSSNEQNAEFTIGCTTETFLGEQRFGNRKLKNGQNVRIITSSCEPNVATKVIIKH